MTKQTLESKQPEQAKLLQMSETNHAPLLERLSNHSSSIYLLIFFFAALLLVWSVLDHSVPYWDAACHCQYSNVAKDFLRHPKDWNWLNLKPVLTVMFNYPAAIWFINGLLKLLVGTSRFSEQLILSFYMGILSLSIWSSVRILFQDKLKALLSVVFVNLCPVLLYLQHDPLIDLPFVSLLFLFYHCQLKWWRNPDWKRTVLLAIAYGVCLCSKQIALLYATPLMCIALLIALRKRQWKQSIGLVLAGITGALFLLTWIIPNYDALVAYSKIRSAFASGHMGFWQSLQSNVPQTFYLMFQSISIPCFIVMAFLLPNISKRDLQILSPFLLSAFAGPLLINIVAFYNSSQSRYYVPAVVGIFVATGIAAAILARKSRKGELLVLGSLGVISVQAILLCFQQSAPFRSEAEQLRNPVYLISGIREPEFLQHLSFVPANDDWKQAWLFDTIEKADPQRPVYLNVLSNSQPYNLGTMAYLAHQRKSKLKITTWRGIGSNMLDTFAFTGESLSYMQWVVQKTGDESKLFFDEQSRINYQNTIDKLQHDGKYIEVGRQKLPDGTELVLFRNRRWIIEPTPRPIGENA